MNDTLLDQLTKLDLEEKIIKRNIDRNYCNEKIRTRLFSRLKEIKKEKEAIKFKIRLERKIEDGK